MTLYAVIPCAPWSHVGYHEHLVIVDAEDELAAAAEARKWIESESAEDLDPGYLDGLFALAIDPTEQVAVEAVPAYVRCPDEVQCCGGRGLGENAPHGGFCPSTTAEPEP